MARPSKFNERMTGLVRALCQKGATDNELAVAMGISPRTLALWKHDHPSFLQALEDGKEIADDLVEASLFQRAVGWSQPETKAFYNARSDKVVEHRQIERFPPDVAACTIWLKNRRPEQWRDNFRHEHTGKDGAPIEVAASVQIVIGLPGNGREAALPDTKTIDVEAKS